MAFSRVPVTAADATFSVAGAAAWAAGYRPAGADVGGVTFCDTAISETTSANLTYSETGSYGNGPKFQVGSGSTTSAGWALGYYASGVPAIWPTSVTASNVNYSFAHTSTAGGTTVLNGVGAVSLCANNVEKVSLGSSAGLGPSITAGTAASAVSALSLTQTWNYNTAAIQGVDWTFTDTSSHASTNAFRIRGGASGTTDLFSVSKAGLSALNGGMIWGAAGAGRGFFTVTAGGFTNGSGMCYGWSANADGGLAFNDTALFKDSAGVVSIRKSGANPVVGSDPFGQLNVATAGLQGVTYANRPGTPAAGMTIYITDSSTATWGATIAGGGANKVLAFYNGTNWTVAGA